MALDAPEPPETHTVDSASVSGTSVSIKGYLKIHLIFAIAYWISLTVSISVLQLVHHPGLYWLYSMDFANGLLALFLAILPLMVVMSANMKKMRGHLGNSTAERDPVLVGVVLVGLALVLLAPVTWSVRYLVHSFTAATVFATIAIAWLAVYLYVVSARAIDTVDPLRFMRICCRRPHFWSVFAFVSLLVFISLAPLIGGIMASEAWQYYSVEELVIRRLPLILMFGLPSALVIPLLPLSLESLAAEREISWTWD